MMFDEKKKTNSSRLSSSTLKPERERDDVLREEYTSCIKESQAGSEVLQSRESDTRSGRRQGRKRRSRPSSDKKPLTKKIYRYFFYFYCRYTSSSPPPPSASLSLSSSLSFFLLILPENGFMCLVSVFFKCLFQSPRYSTDCCCFPC